MKPMWKHKRFDEDKLTMARMKHGMAVLNHSDAYDALTYALLAVERMSVMNTNDITVALTFMVNCNYDYVVLQCKFARDIPYIKRELIQRLGQPSKTIDNTFYYSNTPGHMGYRIVIVPVHKEERIRGYANERVFYVAHKDNSDWHELCATNGVKQRLVPYEVPAWATLSDVYTWLLRDGMTGDEALHRMRCDGLI
jgi:hypothetical protein